MCAVEGDRSCWEAGRGKWRRPAANPTTNFGLDTRIGDAGYRQLLPSGVSSRSRLFCAARIDRWDGRWLTGNGRHCDRGVTPTAKTNVALRRSEERRVGKEC